MAQQDHATTGGRLESVQKGMTARSRILMEKPLFQSRILYATDVARRDTSRETADQRVGKLSLERNLWQ